MRFPWTLSPWYDEDSSGDGSDGTRIVRPTRRCTLPLAPTTREEVNETKLIRRLSLLLTR